MRKAHRARGPRCRGRPAALGAAVTLGPGDGTASSHREAPLIADDPSADLTDVYAFRSPDKPDTVTILANVIPGEDPAAGPNWYTFSPTARYNLKIDTNGDVQPDVIYRFQFKRKTGPFFLGDTAQPYTVTRIAKGKTTVVARGTTPPNNIGPRSTPNYRGWSRSRSSRSTAAPRRRSPASGTIRSSATSARSSTSSPSARAPATWAAARTSSPATASTRSRVQVPIAGLAAKNGTIGVWASVDRRKVTTRGAATRDSGGWVQVNRLGNPLVNEVIIPTGLKDRWNAQQPWNESAYRKYYTRRRSSPR